MDHRENSSASPGYQKMLDDIRSALREYADDLRQPDAAAASLKLPSELRRALSALFDTHPELTELIRQRPDLRRHDRDECIEIATGMLAVVASLFQPSAREMVRCSAHSERAASLADILASDFTRRQEANAIVCYAFRNGFLEDLHAGKHSPLTDDPALSRITDEEMKRLMIEACRKMNQLLRLKDEEPDAYRMLIAVQSAYTVNWEQD